MQRKDKFKNFHEIYKRTCFLLLNYFIGLINYHLHNCQEIDKEIRKVL